MKPTIIYEDNHFLVLNKPAGLVVHPDGKTEEPSLCDWLISQYPTIKEVGEPWTTPTGEIIYRPGIVHRLDRETSGVMVVAKTQEAFDHLKSQFQERETGKVYNAFVYGNIKEEEGTIDRPIGRSKTDFRKWSAQRFARGKLREAVTDFKVLERGNNITFVEVMPRTGRTHQIRVHFKAINHPIVADKLYAPNHEPVLGFNRLALHAQKLAFNDFKGQKQSFEAPLPADFVQALDRLKA